MKDYSGLSSGPGSSEPSGAQAGQRRRIPRQRRSRERVERILDAAAAVFGEVGYEAATTHLIAERAQTAVGTLYQFFPDKRAIFRALEERHMARVVEYQARMLTPELVSLPLEQVCAHLVDRSAAFLVEPTALVMYLLYFTAPQLFERFDENFIAQMVRSAAALIRTRNPALTDAEVDVAAEVFIQTFNHLLFVAMRNRGERRARLIAELKVLLVAYLRTCEPPDSSLPPQAAGEAALTPRQRTALAQAQRCGELTLQQLAHLFPDQSRRTLQRDLHALVEQGRLVAIGHTNRRTYRPAEPGAKLMSTHDGGDARRVQAPGSIGP